MTQRYITLPNQSRTSLGAYASAWRTLRKMEADNQKGCTVSGFYDFPVDAYLALRDLRYGMHDRINRHLPWFGKGRHWDYQFQTALRRDAVRLADIARRVRVYQFETDMVRERFGYLLANHGD